MNNYRKCGRLLSTSSKELAQTKAPKEMKAVLKKKVNTAVYGCGLSASGSLSVPKLVVSNRFVTSKQVENPIRISQLNTWDIKHVAAGFGFSLFASDSKLYGSGLNNRYQLTTRKTTDKPLAEYYISCKLLRLPEDSKILSISSGRAHSLVATTAGVYAFGENCHGQCGQNPELRKEMFGTADQELPRVQIPSTSPVKAVHCLLDTSLVLTEAGEVFAFGLNEDGQCANGSQGLQWKPTKITGEASDVKIKAISGTSDTPIAVSEDGNLFIWGQCEYGQPLLPNIDILAKHSVHVPLSNKKVISAASSSSACLIATSDGEALVWGVGLLGMGPDLQRQGRPLKMDQPLFDNEKVIQVVAGITSFGAVNAKGRMYVWGQNRFGLLGLGHKKDQYFPFQVSLPADVKKMAFIERAAGLVVYRRVGGVVEYLLLQASYPPYHWTPPKGHVDPGEDEWTAAIRETDEEAGIKKEQLSIHEDCHETLKYEVPKRGNPSLKVPKTVKYWLAGLKDVKDVQLSHEHQNMKWAPLEEAIKIAVYAEMDGLFRKFDSYLAEQK